MNNVQASYNEIADEYVRRIFDELKDKPFDRAQLSRLAQSVPAGGMICDLGSGPGQVARYLHSIGANAMGVDLSDGMIKKAIELNPGIKFQVGDMTKLDIADESWDGIAAFYSIVNLPPERLPAAFSEMYRVLRPGGHLLLAFHVGNEKLHFDEWWDHKVSLDFYFFDPATVAKQLTDAGFHMEEILERDSYPEVEHQSRRAYIFCKKPL